MRYQELYDIFAPQYFFSLQQIRLVESDFRVANIHARIQSWYIQQITKGWYIFSKVTRNEELNMIIANTIYTPSYSSMESAFRYYDFIPEWVYMETSISTKKSQLLNWSTGVYKYYNLSPKFFRWWNAVYSSQWKRYYLIAEPEKAICDWFYLKSYKSTQDFQELRMSSSSFKEHIDTQKLVLYAQRFASAKLLHLINSFIIFMQEHD